MFLFTLERGQLETCQRGSDQQWQQDLVLCGEFTTSSKITQEFSEPTPKYSRAVAPGAEGPVGEDVLGLHAKNVVLIFDIDLNPGF